MTIHLLGFQGGFYLGLPVRLAGYAVLALEILSLLVCLFLGRRREPADRGPGPKWRWGLLGLLLLVAPFASQSFLIQLPAPGTLSTPGVPLEPPGPVLSLFGALPWLAAAGFLGVWQAMLVGLVGGLARGGWETLSLLTPLHMALQAGGAALLLRQSYSDVPARMARQPVGASLLAGGLYGSLRLVELFLFSGGDLFDGVAFAASRANLVFAAALVEAGIAGVVCQGLRSAAPEGWYQVRRLIPSPYNRSLAARIATVLLLLGVAASGVILYGDLLLARSAALELLENQMAQTARQASQSIPYFILTGRAHIREYAGALASNPFEPAAESEVADLARFAPYFSLIEAFTPQGGRAWAVPADAEGAADLSVELGTTLSSALTGVPQETVLAPLNSGGGSRLVFLSPITPPGGGEVQGAVVGVTDLTTNPQFAPIVDLLRQTATGQAFIVDDGGTILVHPEVEKVGQSFRIPGEPTTGLRVETAADGTRQLVYLQTVEGYTWQIVITEPERVLDRLAMSIALRLFQVIAVVGVLAIVVAYISSRRLTKPLGRMTEVAESIAKGNLELPVPEGGEDEVGRLAASFERMRLGLKAKLEEMDLLLAASQGLASSFDLGKVFPEILAGIRRHSGGDVVRLALVPTEAALVAVESYAEGDDPGSWRRLDAQVLELCRERGRFILENPARARAVLDLSRIEAPIEALVALPILNEEVFVGALWIGYRTPHLFSPDMVRLLSILASQLGVSVANARLYHRVEQERLRLGAVLEATPDAVLVTDGSGRLILANPAARSSVLRDKGEGAIGKPADEVMGIPELVELVRAPGRGTRTAEIKLEDGRVLSASTSDIEGGPGGRWGQVCVLRDVTYYKRIDVMKSEFVSTVSHDLRAPLTLSQGYATMLSMVGTLNEEQKEFVRKILKSVEQMKQLIDNLLDLGRIEAGIGLSLTEVGVQEVIHEVVANHRPQAVNRQITLEVDLEDSMQPIRADATLLQQAIANLVDNAIKYTPSGGRVVVRGAQRDGRQIIQVEDTGVGVAPTDQPRLFERFYRARRRGSLGARGSGLGLAIVKSIAEQHGGDVKVDSRLGQGSVFTLDLPIEAVASPIRP